MLSIGAFSKISNVTPNTLRYYDEIGLIKPVYVNRETGYRYYDVKQFETILLINKLKQYGFSLEEVAEVLQHPEDDRMLNSMLGKKQREMLERLKQYELILEQMKQDRINLERGIGIMSYLEQIQVKLIETEPKNIYFIRENINVDQCGKYMARLLNEVKEKNLTPLGAPMTIFHDDEFNPEHYDAEVAVPVRERVPGTRELSGGLCALSVLKGPYTGLTSVYARLKQWVEEEGYEVADSPYEIYLTDPAETAPEENVTEVYFPVKK